MNQTAVKKYIATITIGLQKGYTNEMWNKQEVITRIQAIQNQMITTQDVYLSCALSICDIVLSGQIEPSLKLDFIHYPRFPMSEVDFKTHIMYFAKQLKQELLQHRIVIVFQDEIVMLEDHSNIDPRIKNEYETHSITKK